MYDLYHVVHICCCPKCKGRLWSHSQGDWNEHLRFVEPSFIIDIPAERLSNDSAKREKQIRAIVSKHTKKQK